MSREKGQVGKVATDGIYMHVSATAILILFYPLSL